jgi:hypothetical protein
MMKRQHRYRVAIEPPEIQARNFHIGENVVCLSGFPPSEQLVGDTEQTRLPGFWP